MRARPPVLPPRNVPVGQLRRTLEAVRVVRLNFVFGVLFLLLALLMARFAQLQIVHGATYRAQADQRQAGRVTAVGVRGRIVDVHGRLLATSSFGREVAVDPDPRVLPDAALGAFCARLAGILDDDQPPELLGDRLRAARAVEREVDGPMGLRWKRRGSRHVVVRAYVDEPRVVTALDEAAAGPNRLPGLKVRSVERRAYPNGPHAAHVLGLPPRGDADGGGEGVEALLDERLEGSRASARVGRDGKARWLAHGALFDRTLLAGGEVRLTLDVVVQHHLEAALDLLVKDWTPTLALGIVLDPRTGEVLALANRPTFDPNPEHRREVTENLAVSRLFEPGSVLKPFTIAWALAHGFPADTVIPMPQEHRFEGDIAPIRDSHAIGDGDVVHLLAHSSSVGTAWVSDWLGPAAMPAVLDWLEVDLPTDVELPHEQVWTRKPRTVCRSDQLRMAYGYSLRMTPIRLAASFAAFAREDARAVRPTLVPGAAASAAPGAPLCRPEDLALVRRGLEGCVDVGTAREAFAGSPWRPAGKTGTAIIDGRTRHVCSFVGYVPRRDPRLLVLVMAVTLRSQEGGGGKVAAPAVRRFLERALPYLGVPPDGAGRDA
jgi:cell division protein FtsI/penicillin-binding protein 2